MVSPHPPKLHWGWRLLRAVSLFFAIPYLAVTALMVWSQRDLIFRPTRTPRLPAAEMSSPGQPIRDVELITDDGLTLHGWQFSAAASSTGMPRLLVLYFPGNGGCRLHRCADCQDFTRLDCDVLLFDYRGYGDNPGSPSEDRFAADAQAAWRYATGELGYSPQRIVLFGESLGGAVATRLAASRSQAAEPPAALMLNSTFASLGETVAWHYPAFPFQYLLWDRFASTDHMPHVTCPVLQFHGTDDDLVPIAHGRRLFAAVPKTSPSGIASQFITIEGGRHNFITMAEMHAAVGKMLEEIEERLSDGSADSLRQ